MELIKIRNIRNLMRIYCFGINLIFVTVFILAGMVRVVPVHTGFSAYHTTHHNNTTTTPHGDRHRERRQRKKTETEREEETKEKKTRQQKREESRFIFSVVVHGRSLLMECFFLVNPICARDSSLLNCGEVEDVVGVLTLVCRGVAQVFHDLLVELRLLLVAEAEEREKEDRQEEGEEVKGGSQVDHGDGVKVRTRVELLPKEQDYVRTLSCAVPRKR